MPVSSAELQNWRTRPEYNRGQGDGSTDLFNLMRNLSWGNMGVINRMPFVFDPSKYWSSPEGPASPDMIREAIKPGSAAPGTGLLAMLGPEKIQGILGSLGITLK